MPRDLRETAQFKSDKKRVKKSGRHDWEKLRSLVALLIYDRQGTLETGELVLVRTGSHSELF